MTLLAADSFDYYTDLLENRRYSGTAVIVQGVGRNGTAGVRTVYNDTYFLESIFVDGEAFESAVLFRGIAIELEALPPAAGRATLLQFMEADETPHIAITVNDVGIVEVYRGTQAGVFLAASVNPIAVGTKYSIEGHVGIDDAVGVVVIKLWTSPTDVATVIDFAGDTRNGGTGLIGIIGHGADGAVLTDAVPPSAIWDDTWLCDDQGAAPHNTFLGNVHVTARLMIDAGFYTAFVPVPEAPNLNNIKEADPDGDTRYNYAPNSDSVVSASFVGAESALDSSTCNVPPGAVGDLLFVAIRSFGVSEDLVGVHPNVYVEGFGFTTLVPPMPPNATLAHFHFFPNFESGGNPPSGSLTIWQGSVAWRNATDAEPASYTFLDINGDPMNVAEIVIVRYTGASVAVPVEHASIRSSATDTPDEPNDAVSFTQVDADTDNCLVIAFTFTEEHEPQAPAGYAADYAGGLINVASKVNAAAGAVNVPGTALAGLTTWGTDVYVIRARSIITVGGKDSFKPESLLEGNVLGAMVNLCARHEGGADHAVKALMRLGGVDLESAAQTPEGDYSIRQFPFALAPDGNPWETHLRLNESEAGYALAEAGPPPPPAEAVVFYADAEQLVGLFADAEEILEWTEGGIHNYVLEPSRALAGDWHMQTFKAGGIFPDAAQPSVEGFTEPVTCSTTDRNAGFTHVATDSDLFLAGAFTLVAVVRIAKYEGCWNPGGSNLIVRRGNDAGAIFTGWQLPYTEQAPGTGTIYFSRIGPGFETLCIVQADANSIAEGDTHIVTVICDGATLRLLVDGVEHDSTAYVTGVEPAASDLHFLNNGNGADAPMGQTPYLKIWNVELEAATLTALWAELAARFQ